VFRVDLGVSVLTMATPGVKQPSDELLPLGMREPPEDLAALDELLSDPRLAPMADCWQVNGARARPAVDRDRDLLRLMVIEQPAGWGYETLVREVSDAPHLRRFCLVRAKSPLRGANEQRSGEPAAPITRSPVRYRASSWS
jgi:hypothetical protein